MGLKGVNVALTFEELVCIGEIGRPHEDRGSLLGSRAQEVDLDNLQAQRNIQENL